MTGGGIKNDDKKPKIHLITKDAIFDIADVLTWGGDKYGEYNFMKGIQYTRLANAAIRHILQFLNGEDLDSESNKNHIAHAGANIAMLLWMIRNRPDCDDRCVKQDCEQLKLF